MSEKYLDKEGLAYLWSKIPKEQVWVGTEEPTGDQTVWIDPSGSETEGLATKTELANKQDKLTAGNNITIDANNIIFLKKWHVNMKMEFQYEILVKNSYFIWVKSVMFC